MFDEIAYIIGEINNERVASLGEKINNGFRILNIDTSWHTNEKGILTPCMIVILTKKK